MIFLALTLVAACKGDDRHDATAGAAPARTGDVPSARADNDGAGVAEFDSALAEQGLHLNNAGRVSPHSAAGFEIYWPSGCGKLRVGEPDAVDPDATQEYLYTCDRFKQPGTGCSVYVLQNGRDENGGPPSPAMVVNNVESVLTHYAVRPERQRPLTAAGMEGVEVQAVEPAGRGEVWVRGLLAGTHMYILTAWNNEGGVFEDEEVKNFFASFRLIQ